MRGTSLPDTIKITGAVVFHQRQYYGDHADLTGIYLVASTPCRIAFPSTSRFISFSALNLIQ
jgi:hypothetical protein